MAESTQSLLKRLIDLVEAQSLDIQALRNEVRALKSTPPPAVMRAIIEPDMGLEYMGLYLDLDAKTWAAIKDGAHVTVKGHGYIDGQGVADPNDRNFRWDYWEFFGGIGQRLRVRVRFINDPEMKDPEDDAFDSNLRWADVQEYSAK